MPDEHRRSAAGTVAGTAAALTALLLTAPRPSAAVALLRDADVGGDPTAPLVAAVALAAWAVSAWLALTVAGVLLSRVPGALGRCGRAVAARVAPSTVRRAVEVALGLTVAVGVVAPSSALAAPVVPAPAVTTSADSGWDLDWPSASEAPVVSTPAPVTPRPTTAPARAAAPVLAPPRAAAPLPAVAPPPAVRPAPPRAAAVVVRSGDTLWSLAERSLRAAGTAPTARRVAVEWPRWWAANREAVGDDPDLLLPGTVLRPPPGSAPPR